MKNLFMLILSALLLSISLKAAPKMAVGSSPLSWMKIVTPDDPSYHGKIQSIFGQTAGSDLVTSVLPYGLVITHAGTRNLQGIAVRWLITTGGKTVPHHIFLQYLSNPARTLMHPGDAVFFCPLPSVNFLSVSAKAQKGAGAQVSANDQDAEIIRRFNSADSVSVSIDLIVADDGSAAGPDTGKAFKIANQQYTAYADLRANCLSLMNKGGYAAVVDYLTPISQKNKTVDPETGISEMYSSTQIGMAKRWLAVLQTPDQLPQLQDSLTRQTPEKVFPITLKVGLQ